MDNSFPRLIVSNEETNNLSKDEWIVDQPRRPLFSQNYVTALLGPFDEVEERRLQIRMVASDKEKD